MTISRAFLVAAACFAFSSCAAPNGTQQSQALESMAAHTSVQSQTDFDSTAMRLEQAIEKRKLTLFQVIDHGAGARSVDKPIGNSKLFLFGSPSVGTNFMQVDLLFGLDLPLKALVYEKDGAVYVATPNIDELVLRRGVDGLEGLRSKVRGALAGIANEAAQQVSPKTP